MLNKIEYTELKIGMVVFVNKSWLKTPFLFKSVEIQTDNDLAKLYDFRSNLYCRASQQQIVRCKKSISLLSVVFDDLVHSRLLDSYRLTKAVNNLVTQIVSHPEISIYIDNELKNHPMLFKQSVRLLSLSCSVGKHLSLSRERINSLAKSAFLLDIGMVSCPDVLYSPASLNASQTEKVVQHCEYGAELLQRANIDNDVVKNVLCHHENMDGSGYPNGLSNKEIPFEARLLRILNIYEAITSDRRYSAKCDASAAINELHDLALAGKVDSRIIEKVCLFLRMFPQGSVVTDTDLHQHKVTSSRDRYVLDTINLFTGLRDRVFVYEVKSIQLNSI